VKRLVYVGSFNQMQWVHLPFMAIVSIVAYRTVHREMPETSERGESLTAEIVTVIILMLGFWLISSGMQFEHYMTTTVIMLVFLPFLAFAGYIAYAGSYTPNGLIGTFFNLLPLRRLFVVSAYLLLFCFLFFLFMESPVFDFLTELMASNTTGGRTSSTTIYIVFTSFLGIWIFYLTVAAIMIASSLIYYSALEQEYALSIFEQIKKVGTQKQIRGLMKE
jgi:hypothetical protein